MHYRSHSELLEYLSRFDAKQYGRTRNHIDGGVSKLSPYITHGIISTKECIQAMSKRYSIKEAEKFLMELVWKEFFLQVQKSYGNDFTINPVREDKTSISKNALLPDSIPTGSTHTIRINTTIQDMRETGRLHNHQRMWLASRCCHRAKLDRKLLADWTYYHFIDGELSANHLSWQWVNSTFGNKAYMMNEENLQKYRPGTTDPDLRGSYEDVADRLFDEDRKSAYRDETDVSQVLVTPTNGFDVFDISSFAGQRSVRLLSPWRLDETLLADELPTLVLLDTEFTKLHPRSQKRIDFVRQYTTKAQIPFVLGSYNDTIQHLLDQGTKVILDERRDPVYRTIQQELKHNEHIDIIPYPRINTSHPEEPILKFFKYRNKTTRFIKEF